jgi:hypothetical protein
MRNLSILFLLVCAPIFAFAQGGPGQSNYPVSQITFQNNGTPVTPAVNGSVIINYVSGCTTTVSGSTASITCTGGGGVSSLTCDGTIFSTTGCNASTGAVTLTLANTVTGTGGVVLATAPTVTNLTTSNLIFSAAQSHIKTASANKDVSGGCTMTAGACGAITFSTAYVSQPACTVTWDGITGTLTGVLSSHAATTGLTPTSSVGTDTAKVFYVCIGNPN